MSSKPKGGLTKWFKEEWVDLKTGKKWGALARKRRSGPIHPADRKKLQRR